MSHAPTAPELLSVKPPHWDLRCAPWPSCGDWQRVQRVPAQRSRPQRPSWVVASFTHIYYSVAIKQIRVLLVSCPVAAVRRQGVRCCRPRLTL